MGDPVGWLVMLKRKWYIRQYLLAIHHHVPEDKIDADLQFVGNQCWKLNPDREDSRDIYCPLLTLVSI